MNKIYYKKLKKNEFNLCLNFFLKYYKGYGLSRKSIKWEYLLSPFGKAKVFVAICNKRIIGTTSSIPINFKHKSKILKGFRTQDVLIDKKFRGQGIFQNLLKLNDNYLDKNSNINISFPNEKSLHVFIKNKWVINSNIPLITKKLIKNEYFKLKYIPISKFNSNHYNLWKKNIKNNIDLYWTKNFLNWRYFLNPKSKYNVFEITNNNEAVGFLVLKIHNLNPKKKIGHLCQLVSNKKFFNDNFSFINNYFLKHSVKNFTMWGHSKKYLFLKKNGFKKFNLLNRKFITRSKSSFKNFQWDLSMVYSDVY